RIVSVGSASNILYLDSNQEFPHATQSTLFRPGTLVAQMHYSGAIEGRAVSLFIKAQQNGSNQSQRPANATTGPKPGHSASD
ncbi:MAG: hypothetical protein ABWZ38_08720, partial [Candidatus Binatia bacterium]